MRTSKHLHAEWPFTDKTSRMPSSCVADKMIEKASNVFRREFLPCKWISLQATPMARRVRDQANTRKEVAAERAWEVADLSEVIPKMQEAAPTTAATSTKMTK
eukprot:TRINITY_DN23515_c0_g1_i1.p2 TRINITY_DN23515_c0_g1~~TRINITY_DN23515_c0_g1_i1.p2  ORF type:complete len:103 (-),score=25.03 TRINITY_DN23515_c0_g1_i1:39-347(-)